MWAWDIVNSIGIIWGVSGFFAFMSTGFSIWLIYKHLMNYTKPHLQRYIVRIIIMVPIYAIDSWISLRWIEYSIYFDLLRDSYEAYVVYSFFALLVSFINHDYVDFEEGTEMRDMVSKDGKSGPNENENRVVEILERKEITSHPKPTCCFPKFKPGKKFLYTCKRCVYQFIIIKPLGALVAIILFYYGMYDDTSFRLDSPYLYIIAVDNVSVTLAMYMLYLFYHVMQEELKAFNPVPKFVCIKAVILFAFWQGIAISFLVYFNILTGNGWTTEDVSVSVQDFLICIEMFLVSILHMFTFSHKPYRSGEASCEDLPCYSFLCCCCCFYKVTRNLSHVVSQRDVLADGVDTFSIDKVPSKITNLGKGAKDKIGSVIISTIHIGDRGNHEDPAGATGEVVEVTEATITTDDKITAVDVEL